MRTNIYFRHVFVVSAAMVANLFAVGCGDLIKQPYPAKSYFAIEPGMPSPATVAPALRPVGQPVVLIRAVRVSPPYDGLGFIYQTGPAQYTTDYYDNWIAAPSAQLTGALADWLGETGAVGVVVPGSSVRANYILDSEVTRLVIDYSALAHAHAVLVARFFVTRPDTGGSVLEKSYSAEIEASSNAPAAYAAAWGQAYREVLSHLTGDLQHAIVPRG